MMNKPERPLLGVAVLVFQNRKVLLGKRRGSIGAGSWSCAGGHLEFGETFKGCAARELEEETGLVAKSLKVERWSSNIIDGKHFITFFVLVEVFEGVLELKEPKKCAGWEWFERDALPNPLFPTVESYFNKTHETENMRLEKAF